MHELGIDPDGRVYFTMRLVEGRELREVFRLSRKGEDGWSRTRVLGILLRVCEAMAFAHSKGVIHRDLKPANIMVGRFGAVYVMDWGLAKVLGREDSHDIRIPSDSLGGTAVPAPEPNIVATDRSDSDSADNDALVTMDGDIVGTPSYMPPEQAAGQLDELGPRADVYSIGAMLYELLTGQMPYEPLGERVPAHTILNAVRTTPPWPVLDIMPETPLELVAICEKAMAREIDDRYADMSAFATDVRAYLEGHVVTAYETGVTAELRKWVERNKVASLVATALLLVLVGSIAGFIWQQRQSNILTGEARDEALRNLNLARNRQTELEIEQARADDAVREAKSNLQRAQEKEDEAERQANIAHSNALQAQVQSLAAERKSYLAGLVAADYSLRLGEVKDAKSSLAGCERSMRGWEWDFLHAESDTSLAIPIDQTSAIFFAEFIGPDRILSVGFDQKVSITRIEDGRLEHSFQSRRSSVIAASELLPESRAAALAPGGRYVAVSTLSNVVSLFDLHDRSPESKPKPVRLFGGHAEDRAIRGIAISNDGRYLASCSGDMTVRVFDFETAETLAVLSGLEFAAQSLDFSPTNSNQLAIAGVDFSVRVWDWSGEEEPLVLQGHRGVVNGIDWSPDGSQLASVSDDRTLRIWDPAAGRLVSTFSEHTEAVMSVEYGVSPGALRVVTSSRDTTVRVWNPHDGEVLGVFAGHVDAIRDVHFEVGGDRVMSASSDGTVRLWSLAASRGVERISLRDNAYQARVVGCEFDQAGKRFLTAVEQAHVDPDTGETSSSGEVCVWNRGESEPALRYATKAKVAAAAFVDGDRALAILLAPSKSPLLGAINTVVGDVELQTIRLVIASAETGEYIRDLPLGQSRELFALAANRTGTLVAVAGRDREILVFEVASGKLLQRLEGHKRSVRALAFSADGRSLASGSQDKTVRVWDLEKGETVREFEGHKWQVNVVAFNEQGTRLGSGSNDRTVRLWDLESGELIQTLEGHDGAVYDLSFTPSGRRVLTAGKDNFVRVFEPESGDALLRLRGHTESVLGLAVHADGKMLLSSSADGTLRVWDSRSARERVMRDGLGEGR